MSNKSNSVFNYAGRFQKTSVMKKYYLIISFLVVQKHFTNNYNITLLFGFFLIKKKKHLYTFFL